MRIWSIARRILKELFRDKRTLALLFVAPLLILTLMKVVFDSGQTVSVNVGTVAVSKAVTQNIDATAHVHVVNYATKATADKQLANGRVDAIIEYANDKYTVTYANVDASKTAMVRGAFSAAQIKTQMKQLTMTVARLQQQTGTSITNRPVPQVKSVYRYGDQHTTYFDKIMPILMGFFVFFFVFLISGMSLLRERTTGTLERLLATPVKRSEIVFGYMVSYGLLAIVQTMVIVSYTIWGLGVTVNGSIFWVMVTNILLATLALAFGLFMSTFAKSEFQMVQFIPLIVVPQIFFSGLISLDSMAKWVELVAAIIPMKYAGDSLTKVIMTDSGWTAIWPDLGALLIFINVLTIGNIVGLKRYRKV